VSTINTGGPAFPVPPRIHSYDNNPIPGMTLRDWFAGQALSGMPADELARSPNGYAKYSYELADAMIAERSKK